MSYSVLILTHNNKDGSPILPHIKWLILSNPEADVHIISDNNPDKKNSWRNCDRKLRDWWKMNSQFVSNSIIYVLEYDVLVSKKLPVLPSNFDFIGKDVKLPRLHSNWAWFKEAEKFKPDIDTNITGIAPLAFLGMRRDVLNELCDEKWDEIFNRDIFCEIRLPTIVSLNGFTIGGVDLPQIDFYNPGTYDLTTLGYYHPIKSPLNYSQSQIVLSKLEKHKKYINQ